MLTDQEAHDLMSKLTELREQVKTDNSLIPQYKLHEKKCILKFKYLVTMATNKYRKYDNYDDLNQEGLEALVQAMKTVKLTKGSIFWWFHKYIQTRISRCVNIYTSAKSPLLLINITPYKEMNYHTTEGKDIPDKHLEASDLTNAIKDSFQFLTPQEQDIISSFYGFGRIPKSIFQICKTHKISRAKCFKKIKHILLVVKKNIKL
jgi:DNA-directed RNA polymerase specialized sigma subunit